MKQEENYCRVAFYGEGKEEIVGKLMLLGTGEKLNALVKRK